MASSTPPSTIISPITDAHLATFIDLLTAGLRKSGLSVKPTQEVLETQGGALVDEFVGSVRRRVEAISDLLTRCVAVNRNHTPQDMLDATGRNQYTDKGVVEAMPRGSGDEVEVVFFKVGRYVSDAELHKEYELRGLVPVDPFSLGAVNEADPAFADEHPNGTHWKDANDRWCYATFGRWVDERSVGVRRDDDDWHDHWWFAGVRKPVAAIAGIRTLDQVRSKPEHQ